jgi:predicted acylesterase/phospholipase RssA
MKVLKGSASARTAIVFAAAASRIAQEYVLMRRLVEGQAFASSAGRPIIPAVLAGSSSGALSAVALNAILLTEGLIDGRRATSGRDTSRGCTFGWSQYEQLLLGLKNEDVYLGGRIVHEAVEILRKGSVFDTRPLRRLLKRMVNGMAGFYTLGDLPVPTYISVVERDTGQVHRLGSTTHPELPIVDVLMASASIPVAFPPCRLKLPGTAAAVACIDGATGTDGIPVDAVRDEGCDVLYIVRPMRFDPAKRWNGNPRLIRVPIVDTTIRTLLYMHEALLEGTLLRASHYARQECYVYMPQLQLNYGLLDFDSAPAQIRDTQRWAGQPDSAPQPLCASS